MFFGRYVFRITLLWLSNPFRSQVPQTSLTHVLVFLVTHPILNAKLASSFSFNDVNFAQRFHYYPTFSELFIACTSAFHILSVLELQLH